MAFNWREHLAIHPAAELFPLMSEVELKELAEDIEKNGPRQNIVLCGDPRLGLDNCQLVDGRNRLDALAMLGFLGVNDGGSLVVTKQHTKDGKWIDGKGHQPFCYYLKGEAPYALALSYNVHRRHLTAEQRRDLIAKVIKATPEKSNRQIAEQVKVSHPTVAKVRERLEEKGDVEKVTTSIDTKGRKQPAKKRKAATTSKAVIVNVDTGSPAQDRREADLRRTFTDAVHTLISLTSHPSARFAGIVPPSDLQMVANFLIQVSRCGTGNDAAASAEAMKAKHAAADPALIPDDLSIPPSLRRTAEATS
jgi:DNA-binding Lrp family transcriptional regulator